MRADELKVSCRWLPNSSDVQADGAKKTAMKLRVDADAQVLCFASEAFPSSQSTTMQLPEMQLLHMLSLKAATAALLPGSDKIVSVWAADSEAKRVLQRAEARSSSSGDTRSRHSGSNHKVSGSLRTVAPVLEGVFHHCEGGPDEAFAYDGSKVEGEVEGIFHFKCASKVEASCLLDRIQQAGCIMRGLSQRYEMQKQIGPGGFSNVFSASDKFTGARVAIQLRWTAMRLLKAADLLKRLSHPCIVAFKGLYQVCNPEILALVGMPGSGWALVTEYVSGKGLHEKVLSGEYTEAEARKVVRPLFSALHHAHRLGIVHRDVKPENVIVTPNAGLKLIGFNLACHQDDAESMAFKVGSAGYMAPEVLQGAREDRTPKMDCFAMGSLLYFMLFRHEPPFVGDGGVEFPRGLSAEAKDLIVQLLRGSHRDRPSAEEAMRHPWLSRGWACAPSEGPLRAGLMQLKGTPARPRSGGELSVRGSCLAAVRQRKLARIDDVWAI